jgi:hypothetical protein
MTAVVADDSLSDELIALLADRVPGHVLDRVLLSLVEHDKARPADDDLQQLLEAGVIGSTLRLDAAGVRGGAYLLGLRTDPPSRVLSQLRLVADAYRRPLPACLLDRTLWVLVPLAGRELVEQALVGPGMPALLALGCDLVDLRLGPARRASLDELLDVGERRGWRGVADTRHLEAAARVETLLDIAARHGDLLASPLQVLLDAPQHRELARTLHVWFQCNQDVALTAAGLHLHVNTVRYRLRRAQEVAGVDLEDWDQRLLAELQLRVWAEVTAVDALAS